MERKGKFSTGTTFFLLDPEVGFSVSSQLETPHSVTITFWRYLPECVGQSVLCQVLSCQVIILNLMIRCDQN